MLRGKKNARQLLQLARRGSRRQRSNRQTPELSISDHTPNDVATGRADGQVNSIRSHSRHWQWWAARRGESCVTRKGRRERFSSESCWPRGGWQATVGGIECRQFGCPQLRLEICHAGGPWSSGGRKVLLRKHSHGHASPMVCPTARVSVSEHGGGGATYIHRHGVFRGRSHQ